MPFDVKQFEAHGSFYRDILSKLEPDSIQLLEIIFILGIQEGYGNKLNDVIRKKTATEYRTLYRPLILCCNKSVTGEKGILMQVLKDFRYRHIYKLTNFGLCFNIYLTNKL